MGVFEHFPYVNYHELNLSWILQKLKELEDVIGSQIVDIVARAGVAENAQAISDLTETVETNAETAHTEAAAAQTTANTANTKADTISNSLAIVNGTLTMATDFASAYPAVNVHKSGHIISVSGFINGLNISNTYNTVIGTISGVPAPLETQRMLCNYGDNAYTAGSPAFMSITDTGNLTLTPPATGTNKSVFFEFTYLV